MGARIASRLVNETSHDIIALVRAAKREDAARRLSRSWYDWPELNHALSSGRARVVRGDVSLLRLGLDECEYERLVHTVTHIIHTAADLRLNASIDELRKVNVQGTAHVLDIARDIHSDHGLSRFSHVSTAYVAGGRTGKVPEDSLDDSFGFYSKYELSKYEGEKLVQQAKRDLPVSVFRPGQVVGDSRTGEIKTFNTLYFPLKLYLTRKPVILPVNSMMKVNIVPVDYVVEAIVRLTFLPEAAGLNFHLVIPPEKLPSAGQLISFLRTWAKTRMNLKLPRPVYMPMPVPAARARYKAEEAIRREGGSVLYDLLAIIPYFRERRHFLRDNVDRLLGFCDYNWKESFAAMMEYAVSHGFMHRSERTVHEQVLFRLRSRSIPVSYYDVADNRIEKHDAATIRKDILSAAASLLNMGISRGDRIALLGPNSTKYLILDIAVGLIGAVTVPLYNTSPPSEIDEILSLSSAKLFFLGNIDVLRRFNELKNDTPVVSFCKTAPESIPGRNIMSWSDFISRGAGLEAPASSPVCFNDLATNRDTSGTTGQVKGVSFDHQSLRWMAETTCSMMNAWRALNGHVSYVSYLPMNHVVEGILANYSVYYVPSPMHIYFVEKIDHLPSVLRQVRPDIFFSVPRLYERIWESLMKTRLGKKYTVMGDGRLKRILATILGRAILRKSGLDRCQQLIVGSAPVSELLLSGFQRMGIDIYNGYGLTEAPLVTVNRLGRNRIETVGEPVPGTTIAIADDGEILVKGPQVACGYLNGDSCSQFENSLLHTGDLGYMTEGSSLVLNGRKKDVIVTSYGKNIYPGKIESMLKAVPGVAEALVTGEGRPFCAAVLWVSPDNDGKSGQLYMEREIRIINGHLSHPEQIKRWAIIPGDVTIDDGELTASLKLKRSEVTKRLNGLIDALYAGDTVVHFAEGISIGTLTRADE